MDIESIESDGDEGELNENNTEAVEESAIEGSGESVPDYSADAGVDEDADVQEDFEIPDADELEESVDVAEKDDVDDSEGSNGLAGVAILTAIVGLAVRLLTRDVNEVEGV